MGLNINDLSAPVARAMEQRSVAIAQGIDAAARPVDVVATAASRPHLWTGVLSADDARIGQSLVHDAIAGLEPRIQSNTGAKYAAELLQKGGRIGNGYDAAQTPGVTLTMSPEQAVQTRASSELANGMFGTGTTIYGTVHFADVVHEPLANHVVKTLRYADRHLDTGVSQYGDASLVLGPRAMRNATFLPADTGVLGGVRPLRAVEHLDDVVFEWIVNNFQLGSEAAAKAGVTSNTVFPDMRSARKLGDDFRAVLKMPREQAVAAVREHLTSDAVNLSYMEAQVRIATVDDLVGVNVMRLPSNQIPPDMAADYGATHRALIDAAGARGIPVTFSDDPVPPRVPGGA